MSMGNAAAHGWVISLDNLRQLCPEQTANVEAALLECNATWGEYAHDVANDYEIPAIVAEAFKGLCEAFTAATSTGTSSLELEINWYDEENGEPYDEIDHKDGCFITVAGMWQLSPAGDRFGHLVLQQSWCVYG